MPHLLLVHEDNDLIYAVAYRVRLTDRLRAHRRSRTLDRALAEGAAPESSALLALRAQTLLREPVRNQLAIRIHRILVRAHTVTRLPCRQSTDTAVIRNVEPELAQLARRLADESPVAVSGLATTRILLYDHDSTLYGHDPTKLRDAIDAAIDDLTIPPSPSADC